MTPERVESLPLLPKRPPEAHKGLFGTVGQGLAKVELSSYSGTIRILKRD